jgi:hypothetical protein
MIDYVKDFIEGRMERWEFDLDYSANMIEHYPRMERENPQLADCFVCYIDEQGFEAGQDLPDGKYKALIKKRFKQFMSVFDDGIL